MSPGPDDAEETLQLPPTFPAPEGRVDALTATPPTGSSGGQTVASSVDSTQKLSVAEQDLGGEVLLESAPRTSFNGREVPALGGIPLLAKLGQGGMGAVYFGVKALLRQEVAVKVLPRQLALQQVGMVDRFLREAQIAARVESPHLVRVTDVGEQGGLHYLVMEYVRGESGAGYLKRLQRAGQSVDEATALEICIAATEGLIAAHQDGVIHRDVKPDNILIPLQKSTAQLDFKNAKLADLGLARGEDLSQQSLTGADTAMGTPGYMSPEQALNARKAGKAADVFSMGATLYALLAGKPPFRGETATETVMLTLQQKHVPLKTLRPDVSAAVGDLLERCLMKEPGQRYADAVELKAALLACRVASGGAETPPTHPAASSAPPAAVTRPAPAGRRGPILLASMAVLALAAGIFLFTQKTGGDSGEKRGGKRADTQKASVAVVAPDPAPAERIDVSILTSADKEGWMLWAAEQFAKTPDAKSVEIKVSSLPSELARDEIQSGKRKPTVWAPASGFMSEYFKSRQSGTVFNSETTLAGSPIVVVLLEDRYAALLKKYQDVNFRTITEAMVEGSWQKVGGPAEWGSIRIALPEMSEPEGVLFWGLQAAFRFHESGINAERIRTPELRPWFEALQRASRLPASTRAGVENWMAKGAVGGDGASMFESTLLMALEKNPQHVKFRVIYPRITAWNDHPYYIMEGTWNSTAQRKAAVLFQEHLLSEPVQRKLLEYGLRPVNKKISLRDAGTPWMRHQKLGVSIDIGIRNKEPNNSILRALTDVMYTVHKK